MVPDTAPEEATEDGVKAPETVASVPDVGKVTFVVPVMLKVEAKAPEVVRLPPSVMVLPVLATPVPPYCPATTLAFHVPLVIVPTVARLERLVNVVLLVAVILAAVPDIFPAIVLEKVSFPPKVKLAFKSPNVAPLVPMGK